MNVHRVRSQQVLSDVFGYDSFLPLQEDIVSHVMNRQNALVIMPTGGGKSLCYQIPALMMEGLTLVISPLISLMKDQVDQLKACGVDAVCLNSSIPKAEYWENFEKVRQGEVKLLYLAPEALFTGRIEELLNSVRVDLLAVDEAHCVSEWGHDFRPEYRKLSLIRERFPQLTCIALTATATPRVREDIQQCLQLDQARPFVASFDRPNLFLEVCQKEDEEAQITEIIDQYKGESGIVYCFSRRQVDDITGILQAEGYSALPYHAGLPESDRSNNQDLFIRDEVQIIVATIAFGMGINKPNVRFVIHCDLPKSIESYYQEIGRGGRDGMPAHCRLLFGYGDLQKHKFFHEQKEGNERRVAEHQLHQLVQWAESGMCRRIPLLNYFGETYTQAPCGKCDRCEAPQEDLIDVTVAAQKYLSCIRRTGERFGTHHVIDVLMGSQKKKVLKLRHNELSTYGIGLEYSRKQWQALSYQFLQQGLLQRDMQYGTFSLTQKAWEVFRGEIKIQANLPQEQLGDVEVAKETHNYDNTLIQQLRQLRKRLADQANLPPYAIFPDRTLVEMSTYYPQTTERLLDMHGVGQVKANTYGVTFLDQIRAYCTEHNIEEVAEKKRSTRKKSTRRTSLKKKRFEEVGEAFNAGQTIKELMTEWDVQDRTIFGHLYKYSAAGNTINTENVEPFITLSDELKQQALHKFDELSPARLAPVYEAFNGTIDYNQLHLIRLLYMNQ